MARIEEFLELNKKMEQVAAPCSITGNVFVSRTPVFGL